MNRLFLIAGVAILIAALAFLNQGIKKASPTDADLQQQAQEQQEKANEAHGKTAADTKAPTGSQPSPMTEALPAEETVGDPAKAAHHIQVGWVYDEENQASPQILAGPLQVIRDYVKNSKGTASAEIVNLDVPAEDRSPAAQTVADLGVSVDGNPVLVGSFSEMRVTVPEITKALDAATGKK